MSKVKHQMVPGYFEDIVKRNDLRRLTIVLGLGSSRASLAGVLKAMEKVNKHGGL